GRRDGRWGGRRGGSFPRLPLAHRSAQGDRADLEEGALSRRRDLDRHAAEHAPAAATTLTALTRPSRRARGPGSRRKSSTAPVPARRAIAAMAPDGVRKERDSPTCMPATSVTKIQPA